MLAQKPITLFVVRHSRHARQIDTWVYKRLHSPFKHARMEQLNQFLGSINVQIVYQNHSSLHVGMHFSKNKSSSFQLNIERYATLAVLLLKFFGKIFAMHQTIELLRHLPHFKVNRLNSLFHLV